MTDRTYAPRRNEVKSQMVEPDWFWSISGGIDSVAAYLVTREALHENYQKRPVMVYLDTRIGIPLNRIYTEILSDAYSEQLWTLRTEHDFEADYLDEEGAPGPAAHGVVRTLLKGRQGSKLMTLADAPHIVQGISADESPSRAKKGKVNQKDRHVEVYPVHRTTKPQRAKIILESNCPINPLWAFPSIFTDCACGANGDPSEYDRVEELFPVFMQRLREMEESIEADGVRDTLAWGGLIGDPRDGSLVDDDPMNTGGLTTCTAGCSRDRNPSVVEAFRARATGASKSEAISLLELPDTETRSTQSSLGEAL